MISANLFRICGEEKPPVHALTNH